MKYYVIEISTGDSKIAGKSIYEYETQKEAFATYHSKIGVAMKSTLYTSQLIMVIDENGYLLVNNKYVTEGVTTNG